MVQVSSEVGRLRRVLVHEPGAEVERMVPAMMEELLFDDILFAERTREEHARFRRVLQLFGVDTVDSADLLEAALEDPEARRWLLDEAFDYPSAAVVERVERATPAELVELLVGGVRLEETGSGIEVEELFQVAPLPNWCFQRDPQVVLGDGVAFSSMATAARHREALLSRVIFRFHPELRSTPVLYDSTGADGGRALFAGLHAPRLEGGDVLVLSEDVIAIGNSVRTNRSAIHQLARELARRETGPRWMVVVELPKRRAYMHLDTLMTPVDRDACLVYAPVILPGGSERARVYELDLHARDPRPTDAGDLLSALCARGVDLEPIPCGGSDAIAQQREQWTDGANALAVSPGTITLYDRNVATTEELDRHGFRVIDADDLLLGKEEFEPEDTGRLCVLIASNEMSRARGGPHCLTHPLVRDPLD